MIITCLIGDPVAQSVSPHMYSYFGQKAGFDYYSHIKLRVPADNKKNLPNALEAIKTLGFQGINITIPYKIEVMKYLDIIDPRAEATGAVNAIIFKKEKMAGYNTDGIGALMAMENKLRKITQKDRVVIFGAGGVSRAVTAGICARTKNITVFNREEDFHLAESLKKQMKKMKISLEILPIKHQDIVKKVAQAQFVVNATSVGMQSKDSIISRNEFAEINLKSPIKNKYFFDVVFNPYTTQFLTLADKYKAKICQGLYMTIYQGAASFELWTQKRVDQKDIEFIHQFIKNKMGINN